MATRSAKPAPPECWTVAFVGKGDVSEDNAKNLLDKQLLPETGEVQALLPTTIPKRGSRGLRNVATLLEEEWDIPIQELEPEDMVAQLLQAKEDGETVYLIIFGTDDKLSVELAEAALDAGIGVKDMCAALDDVEFEPEPPAAPEPEAEAPRRGRGRPRKDETVAAEVAGPATIVTPLLGDASAAALLEAAIRQIVREELAVFPGVHAFGVQDEAQPEEERTVRAFVNDDGEYRRATKRSRARDGETEVMLTETEAAANGIAS
jgi:hypothetical protein